MLESTRRFTLRSRKLLCAVMLGLASLLVLPMPGCRPTGGLVDEAWLLQRQQEYLDFSTQEFRPDNLLNVIAHVERNRRDPSFVVPPIPDTAWDGTFEKLYRLRDTSDFSMMYMLNTLYALRANPAASGAASDDLLDKAEEAILNFKYWFTDPTPVREFNGEPVVDDMWYWSENHVLIFHTCEFLAGQLFPDEVFAVSGLTGRQHMERVRPKILTWLQERARWGFTEWHSNVYYNLDMLPLLTLVEWSRDVEIVWRSTMLLDLIWLDVGLHLHRGTFGATHGRSYIKDKASADTEDTFPASKLLFDDTELPYPSRNSSSATLFARAAHYRLPEVLRRIARSDAPLEDRERMNLPIPEELPPAYDDPIPSPPYGLDYGETHLSLWWSMAAQSTWPILPLTLQVAERENLWASQFSSFATLRNLVWVEGDFDQTLFRTHSIARFVWFAINESVLKEVNTHTYRTADYMLSTAQDYRKGLRGAQTHTWQATLSERAMVFTTHPGYLPIPEGSEIPDDWNWQREDEPGPGYWTGEASQPRAAQHRNVAIVIYAPQYQAQLQGLPEYDYRQETHAYFPQAHFDEWAQDGPWTFGRKDDGYVALYSHQPTSWRVGQPEVFQNGDLPFDLVAECEGCAKNVWIVECGNADEWGSFAAFRAGIAGAEVTVVPLPDLEGDGFDDGFDVSYASPSLGTVAFGWHAPLTVDGTEIPIADYPRFDNPFVQVEFDDQRYEISDGSYSLLLDFETNARRPKGPPHGP